ncbi:MAG: hypothetical protein KAG66_23135, partial [Methylococcales bacterium]|nr:hypothetical protein [Methylococcales bacterium]
QIAIVNADPHLPEIRDFNLDKHTFSPNQDGLADRVKPQFDLTKEVEELRVFLLLSDGVEMPITELERDVPAKMPGYHVYDYDGGVDRKATPPEDGTYPVIAIARDAEGQQIRAEQSLTIQFGGVPRAEFVSPPIGDTLRFEATAVSLCDTLQFEVTIENYGDTPIRTTGPAPNIVYDSSWNYNTLGWGTESGAWRVGIGYENALSDYPFRWAIGTEADLQEIDGHLYLMPGERTIVTGSIRIPDVLGERNPQPMWVGLIHEDVEISQFNQRVDAKAIRIDLPDPGNIQPCQPREIPKR